MCFVESIFCGDCIKAIPAEGQHGNAGVSHSNRHCHNPTQRQIKDVCVRVPACSIKTSPRSSFLPALFLCGC